MKRLVLIMLVLNIFLILGLNTSKAEDIENVSDTVSIRQDILDTLVDEVKVLSQLSTAYKKEATLLPIMRKNIDIVDDNRRVINALVNEITAIMYLMSEMQQDIKLNKQLDENMIQIEYLQSKINLIMAELEGMNKVIIAVKGRNKFYCEKGALFSVLITGKKIKTDVGAEIIIEYNPMNYKVIDLVGITSEVELTPTHIENYGIEIKSHDSVKGKIIIELKKNKITGNLWSGILNSTKFECIREASTGINIIINER